MKKTYRMVLPTKEMADRAAKIIAAGFETEPVKWLLHPELGLVRQDDPRYLKWLETHR